MKRIFSISLLVLSAINVMAAVSRSSFGLSSSESAAVADTTVVITYSGNSASVSVASNIKNYVSYTANGAHVVVNQAASVGANSSGEITYILKGSSSNGSFYLTGAYKATVSLQGLTLTNPDSAAINIQNGKRINISSKSGTVNTISDGANGAWKGALMCKGHSEFQGRGTLNVYGNTAHAIWSKEYVEIKNCTINVMSAVKDGLHCQQYFLMESGVLTIKGFGSDGIDVGIKDSTLVGDAVDTGNFTQTGGSITIYMSGATGEGVTYVGKKSCTGGTLSIVGTSAVEDVRFEQNEPVMIYTLLGVRLGEYLLQDAKETLPRGIYIVEQNGTSRKVVLE